MIITDEDLIEEICDLVKEYTCMEMGYFFRYDLRAKIEEYKEYYEDIFNQEVDEDD